MKLLTIAGLGVVLLGFFFLACGGDSESEEETWTLEAPTGVTHGLFTRDALTDESCTECVIGDLPAGTSLKPLSGGCQQAQWDPSYVYCQVSVFDGPLAGKNGWVNEKFIEK